MVVGVGEGMVGRSLRRKETAVGCFTVDCCWRRVAFREETSFSNSAMRAAEVVGAKAGVAVEIPVGAVGVHTPQAKVYG